MRSFRESINQMHLTFAEWTQTPLWDILCMLRISKDRKHCDMEFVIVRCPRIDEAISVASDLQYPNGHMRNVSSISICERLPIKLMGSGIWKMETIFVKTYRMELTYGLIAKNWQMIYKQWRWNVLRIHISNA